MRREHVSDQQVHGLLAGQGSQGTSFSQLALLLLLLGHQGEETAEVKKKKLSPSDGGQNVEIP